MARWGIWLLATGFISAGIVVASPFLPLSSAKTAQAKIYTYVGEVHGVNSLNGETRALEAEIEIQADFQIGKIQGTFQNFRIAGDPDEYRNLVLEILETPIRENLGVSGRADLRRNLKSSSLGPSGTFGQWNLTGDLYGLFQKMHNERVPKYLTGHFRAQDTIQGGKPLHWTLAGTFLAKPVQSIKE